MASVLLLQRCDRIRRPMADTASFVQEFFSVCNLGGGPSQLKGWHASDSCFCLISRGQPYGCGGKQLYVIFFVLRKIYVKPHKENVIFAQLYSSVLKVITTRWCLMHTSIKSYEELKYKAAMTAFTLACIVQSVILIRIKIKYKRNFV